MNHCLRQRRAGGLGGSPTDHALFRRPVALIAQHNTFQLIYLNLNTWTRSAWVGKGCSSVVDGVGSAACFGTLSNNFALSRDNRRVYTVDSGYFRMVNVATHNLTTLAGNSTLIVRDGIGAAACVSNSAILAIDPQHTYVVGGEPSSQVVRTLDLSTLEVKTVAWQVGVSGSMDAVGTSATFGSFMSLAFSPDGTRLFVASATEAHA